MNTQDLNRFSTLKIGSFCLKNRVVVPAMASQKASETGFVTPQTLAHYERLARSKAGIVMVEYTYIDQKGKSEENQLAADDDNKIEGLSKIEKVIHQTGSLSFLQLTHSLAKSSSDLTGGILLGASAIAVPVKDKEMEIPRVLTLEEIEDIKKQFVMAAHRAFLAGFQGVELHSAHGYGLNQMLSPLTNQRSDIYGGSLQARARLLFEIVSEIRIKIPQLLISVRVPGQDNLEGGLTLEDMKWVSLSLEKLGVNLINVSSGLGGWRRPGGRSGEGYLVSDAAVLKSVLNIPVIGVGGIESAEYIDQSLRENNFSLAAVGRAILNDPDAFAARVLKKEGVHHEHNRICH